VTIHIPKAPYNCYSYLIHTHRFIYFAHLFWLLLWTEANPSRVMNSTESNDNGTERENGGTAASQRNFTLK
jgi:hypothetical protein